MYIVDGDFVTFDPLLPSDVGSYWCRYKNNHSDMAEGKLLFKGACIPMVKSTVFVILFKLRLAI